MNCGFFGIRGHPGSGSPPARTQVPILACDRSIGAGLRSERGRHGGDSLS
jgi:hypothetical protein